MEQNFDEILFTKLRCRYIDRTSNTVDSKKKNSLIPNLLVMFTLVLCYQVMLSEVFGDSYGQTYTFFNCFDMISNYSMYFWYPDMPIKMPNKT